MEHRENTGTFILARMWPPWITLFWTSGDVSSGFQSQSGQSYSDLTQAYVLHYRVKLTLPNICIVCAHLNHFIAVGHHSDEHVEEDNDGYNVVTAV